MYIFQFLFQAEKQITFQVFKLYHNEKDIGRLNQELEDKQQECKDIEQKKEQADDVLKDKKKESGKIARELAKAEQEIREVVSILSEF